MKKVLLAIGTISILLLGACTGKSSENKDGTFKPSMDKNTECDIKIVGSYDNFEALEAEFDIFNEKYYPNVNLSYEKIDGYEENISLVLDRSDKPNIFFTTAAMASNSAYDSVFAHADNLSNPDLKMNLDCIRPGLLNHDDNGNVLMVPIFSRTYGALVNKDLFAKEKIEIPTTWSGLLAACDAFANKGYASPMMGYSLKSGASIINTIAYPSFVAELANNPEALALANNLDPAAGEYMRGTLVKVKQLVDGNAIDLSECNKIEDNYNKVILRFFEGDVPMMLCAGDTASGTKKRESKSDAFIANPFSYSLYPVPMTEQGGYFIDSPSVQFSINKNCNDLEMTREFMRFLIQNEELNNMAKNKVLVSPTKEMPLDSIYNPFSQVPAERTFSPEMLGIKDTLATQIRVAAYEVATGASTINQAIAKFGTYK